MKQRVPFVRVLKLSLFYTQQLLALGALLLNLLVLVALNALIATQQQEAWQAVLQRTNRS